MKKDATFYGGKYQYDIICFDDCGKIRCSGSEKEMMNYAKINNWAVAMLIPLRFAKPKETP